MIKTQRTIFIGVGLWKKSNSKKNKRISLLKVVFIHNIKYQSNNINLDCIHFGKMIKLYCIAATLVGYFIDSWTKYWDAYRIMWNIHNPRKMHLYLGFAAWCTHRGRKGRAVWGVEGNFCDGVTGCFVFLLKLAWQSLNTNCLLKYRNHGCLLTLKLNLKDVLLKGVTLFHFSL